MSDLGIVAAGSEQSTQAAAAVLRAGGNAVDAAVAAAFATSAGDPAITSLAGGGVLIHRDANTGLTEICDFFANAPGLGGRRFGGGRPGGGRAGAPEPHPELPPLDFHATEIDFSSGGTVQTFHIGRGAAAVPTAIDGLTVAQERWGRVPLAEVVAPAVRCLRDGFPLTDYQVSCNRVLGGILRLSALGRRRFFSGDGEALTPLAAGDVFRNPALGDTLEQLGRMGVDSWRRELWRPRVLEEFGEEHGGCLTAEDLEKSGARLVEPARASFGQTRVATNPAPAFGGEFVLHTLRLLEAAKLADTPRACPERLHRWTAVFRAISEVRCEHPDILERDNASELFVERLREIVAGAPPSGGQEPRLPGNTTHVSVIDGHGNAAGVSLSHGEGNGHEVPGTGILMNNLLGEEDLFPDGFFLFSPGERLRTMMAPTIVTGNDGTLIVLGSGGSNRIRTAIPQLIAKLVNDGIDPEAAVAEGRIHVENGILSAETFSLPGGLASITAAAALVDETRCFEEHSLFFGGVHVVVRRPDGRLEGAGDPRRGGSCELVSS